MDILTERHVPLKIASTLVNTFRTNPLIRRSGLKDAMLYFYFFICLRLLSVRYSAENTVHKMLCSVGKMLFYGLQGEVSTFDLQ